MIAAAAIPALITPAGVIRALAWTVIRLPNAQFVIRPDLLGMREGLRRGVFVKQLTLSSLRFEWPLSHFGLNAPCPWTEPLPALAR